VADRTATQCDWLLAESCRLSVCLSVCDAENCGSRGWCTGLKVVPACFYIAGMFLFVPSDTFCRTYRLATKRTAQLVEANANVSFFPYRRPRVYSFGIPHYLKPVHTVAEKCD